MPISRIVTQRCIAAPLALSIAVLSGCTIYHHAPLIPHNTATTAQALDRLRIDPATLRVAQRQKHRFDPSDGFDIDEVAMLALANNPDLKLTRDDLGIAHAQAFSAGLLPDPQVGVSSDYPGMAGATRAFNYAVSIDVMAILLRGPNQQSADASRTKIDLGLLWQEWQVSAQAKQLMKRKNKNIVQRSGRNSLTSASASSDRAIRRTSIPAAFKSI